MTTVTEINGRQTPKRNLPLIVGGVAVGLLLGWLLIRFVTDRTYQFNGMVIQSPQPVTNFTLTDVNGVVDLRDFRGKTLLIYYGYTYCPDVCPATLSTLAQARTALGKQANDIQVIMISIDPARDTPAQLADYMTHFDPTFIGLTGTEDEIAAAAIPMGIYYEKRAGGSEASYLMDHTASVAVIDEKGYLRLIYPFDTPSEAITADLSFLIRRG